MLELERSRVGCWFAMGKRRRADSAVGVEGADQWAFSRDAPSGACYGLPEACVCLDTPVIARYLKDTRISSMREGRLWIVPPSL